MEFSRRALLLGAGATALAPGSASADVDLIDPMIGAVTTAANTACGKTFPGPVLPFGDFTAGASMSQQIVWTCSRR